jgi:phospholipid transport system substrate-binding protein
MVVALQDPAVRQDVQQIEQLVRRILVPHIDFRAASNLVLGPHWKDASETQRAAFITEFQAFLVRFYTGALASYVDSGEVPLDVMSFREEPRIKDERQVFVRSQVAQSGGDEVAVEYRMLWRDAWKVIDVSVAGISMVQSYRSNFNSTVKREGLDVLIAQLQQRNQSFATN